MSYTNKKYNEVIDILDSINKNEYNVLKNKKLNAYELWSIHSSLYQIDVAKRKLKGLL